MRTSFQATRPQNFNLVLREQTTNITIRPCLHKRVRVNYITCKSGSYRTEYRYNTSAYKTEPLKGTRNYVVSTLPHSARSLPYPDSITLSHYITSAHHTIRTQHSWTRTTTIPPTFSLPTVSLNKT